jgi:hypothetical protein
MQRRSMLPFILIGVGVVSGASGAIQGLRGKQKFQAAKRIAQKAAVAYEAELTRTNRAVARTNARVKHYGTAQSAANTDVVLRLVEFLQRHEQAVRVAAAQQVEGVEAVVHELAPFAHTLGEGFDWIGGAAKAGVTGAAAYVGVPATVAALGTASTGIPIAALSGVAAENATLAALGGGSLASGGGGMALGATALNVITVGPTMLVAGLVLNGQGEKAVTRAQKFEVEVALSIENQVLFRSLLVTVDRRVAELAAVLERVSVRASRALDLLESEPFDVERHVGRLRDGVQLTSSVKELIATPVLTESGELNEATNTLVIKYKDADD